MDAWRYGIYLLVFTFDISLAALTRSISMWTLEDKFHISARPCIILYLIWCIWFIWFIWFNDLIWFISFTVSPISRARMNWDLNKVIIIIIILQNMYIWINIDYVIESATYRFLFTSCKTLENSLVRFPKFCNSWIKYVQSTFYVVICLLYI